MTQGPVDIRARRVRDRRLAAVIAGSLLIWLGIGWELYLVLLDSWPVPCGYFFAIPSGAVLLGSGLFSGRDRTEREQQGFSPLPPLPPDVRDPGSPDWGGQSAADYRRPTGGPMSTRVPGGGERMKDS